MAYDEKKIFNESKNWSSVNTGEFNVCLSIQEAFPDIVDLWQLQLIIGALYALIMVLGLCGNTLVIYSIACHRVSFSVRTVFILSLATSDIVIALTSLPITAVHTFTRAWYFGPIFCRLVHLIEGGGLFVSSFTLAAIAIDRYLLIIFPTKIRISYSGATVIVCFIWLIGYMLVSPAMLYSVVRSGEEYASNETNIPVCGVFCDEIWPDKTVRWTYGSVVLCLQYIIPLLITLFCYLSITLQVRAQVRIRHSHGNILPEQEKRLDKRCRRTTRMTTIMVVSFMLAWLPMNLLNLVRDFIDAFIEGENAFIDLFSLLFACAHVIAMTSIIWNPLIYSQFSDPFRKVLKRVTVLECSNEKHVTKHHKLIQDQNALEPLATAV